jgi:hypothetical protein
VALDPAFIAQSAFTLLSHWFLSFQMLHKMRTTPLPVSLKSNWTRYLATNKKSFETQVAQSTATKQSALQSQPDAFNKVYVHPLSQRVLLYWQTHSSDWLVKHGLDKHLSIHRDGTFVLRFASQPLARIWTSYENHKYYLSFRSHHQTTTRHLLQDQLMPNWFVNTSQDDRIAQSIDDLMTTVDKVMK